MYNMMWAHCTGEGQVYRLEVTGTVRDAGCRADLQQTCYEAVCDMMWTQGLRLCSSSCLQDAIMGACALITTDKVRALRVQCKCLCSLSRVYVISSPANVL